MLLFKTREEFVIELLNLQQRRLLKYQFTHQFSHKISIFCCIWRLHRHLSLVCAPEETVSLERDSLEVPQTQPDLLTFAEGALEHLARAAHVDVRCV